MPTRLCERSVAISVMQAGMIIWFVCKKMKRAVCISLFLISSLCVFAQNKRADTAKYAFMDYQSGLPDRPLVFLDDKIYEGDLAGLNAKLTHIGIYKGPGACAIFGVKAANGVIIMGTKKKLPMYFSKPSPDTSFDGRVVYIINGELSGKNRADEKDALIRSTVKGRVLNGIYGRKLDSIVTIITRKYAVEQYQKKLSAFSADYKKEVEFQMKYNHNDDAMFYVMVVDGDAKYLNRDDLIRKLYNTSASQIAEVDFSRQQTCCGVNKWVQVFIKN